LLRYGLNKFSINIHARVANMRFNLEKEACGQEYVHSKAFRNPYFTAIPSGQRFYKKNSFIKFDLAANVC